MLEHGGRLREAARRWGRPLSGWIDLSTGIDPLGYPVPPLDQEAWRRLPEENDERLAFAAARYYGNPCLLPVAGSQAAIRALPALFPKGHVAVLAPTYAEHAAAWEDAGHALRRFAADGFEAACDASDIVVLCNPNNPTAECFARERLLRGAAGLARRGGWLVVDEAFADSLPALSLAADAGAGAANVVVLRSLGKFFGLAGARVGFALGASLLLTQLAERLGPWTVTGPSREVARRALADPAWQAGARQRQEQASARLAALLAPFIHAGPVARTPLFCWLPHPQAAALHEALAQRGILVRLFEEPAGLRFGLPGAESEWARLAAALDEVGSEQASTQA